MAMDIHAPIKTAVEVYVTDGENAAAVMWGKDFVMLQTSDYQDAIDSALAAIRKHNGDEWRLMSKEEFYNMRISETTGSSIEFATPGGLEWTQSDLKLE
jgi:hypothetical protein